MISLASKLDRSSRHIMLSAGLLLQVHSVFAADPRDLQTQIQAFLNPPVVSSSNVKSAAHVAATYSDANEQVRAFILGRRDVGADAAAAATAANSSREGKLENSDLQETTRRMLLGQNRPVPAGARPFLDLHSPPGPRLFLTRRASGDSGSCTRVGDKLLRALPGQLIEFPEDSLLGCARPVVGHINVGSQVGKMVA